MKALNYSVGDIITYQAFGGTKRTGVVSEKEEDIKNGRPGFELEPDYNDPNYMSYWGYDSQITKVVPK